MASTPEDKRVASQYQCGVVHIGMDGVSMFGYPKVDHVDELDMVQRAPVFESSQRVQQPAQLISPRRGSDSRSRFDRNIIRHQTQFECIRNTADLVVSVTEMSGGNCNTALRQKLLNQGRLDVIDCQRRAY